MVGRYQEGLFHRKLADTLDRFSDASHRQEAPRLLLSVPPRHGKTETIGPGTATRHLVKYPTDKFLYATHKEKLAWSHSLKVRRNVQVLGAMVDHDGAHLYPGLRKRHGGMWGPGQWEISGGGGMGAVGVGGGTAGIGGTILVADDLLGSRAQALSPTYRKNAWDFYQADLMTRLEGDVGVCLCATRWHLDDPIGRAMALDEDWEELIFPALALENDPLGRTPGEALAPYLRSQKFLERMRANLDPDIWEALYQCRPIQATGGTFQKGWLGQEYHVHPRNLSNVIPLQIFTTVDTNFRKTERGSFFVTLTWGYDAAHGQLYLLHMNRGRYSFTQGLEVLKEIRREWGGIIYVEARANGDAIGDLTAGQYEEWNIPGLELVEPRTSADRKLVDANRSTAIWKAMRVHLPTEANATHWVSGDPNRTGLQMFRAELGDFPAANNDDIVDSQSMAMDLVIRGDIAQQPMAVAQALSDAFGF